MTSRVDPAAVADLVCDVARRVVLPRHRRLVDGDVAEKAPGDLVTVADREAEQLLTAGLQRLLDVPVVGEEASAADPSLPRLLGTAPLVWVVDPVDGTANFVAGSDDFAVMVALVEHGRTVASWIHQPAHGRTYTSVEGQGATVDGLPLRVAEHDVGTSQLTGQALTRFLDDAQRDAVARGGARMRSVGPGRMCAGVDHPAVASGEQDFVLFWRTLPWDHAPGALLVTEAGGVAAHLDGAPYRPGVPRPGLVVARSQAVWDQVAEAFALASW